MDKRAEPNPYAVPQSVTEGAALTMHDQFIIEQVTPLLQPNEQVRFTAVLAQSPSPAVVIPIFLLAGVLAGVVVFVAGPEAFGAIPSPVIGAVAGIIPVTAFLAMTRPYLAAVTDQRVILIRTGIGAFGPRRNNLGIEQIQWRDVAGLDVGGFANNRALRFGFRDGTRRTLRMAPWSRAVSGQRAFFEFAQSYAPAPANA